VVECGGFVYESNSEMDKYEWIIWLKAVIVL
jgi:hypothetical protein